MNNERPLKAYGWIWLKGMAMGAADLIPGVSGGTIALISGIYDELLSSIANLHPRLILQGFRTGWKGVWKEANGPFLLALAGGIFSSLVLFSNILHHLLSNHKQALYAFFFGLVAASVPLVGKTVSSWNGKHILWGLAGTLIAATITSLPPSDVGSELWVLALCASVAACAMILPGISGSFILLLLGAYGTAIGALKDLDIMRIAAICCGALIGLLGFSRILKKLLSRARNQTMSLLTGFLLGSLQALWPWKQNLSLLYTHYDGREIWSQTNAWPGMEAMDMLLICGVSALVGIAVILGLNRLGNISSAPSK